MLTERTGHTATVLSDGSVLILGGVNMLSIATTAELVEPLLCAFAKTGDPIWPRYLHTATLLPDVEC